MAKHPARTAPRVRSLPALAASATAAACLLLPSTSLGARSGGVVLAVNSHAHTLQVVRGHQVHGYRYSGRPQKLRPGSWISFHRAGARVADIAAKRRHGAVTFDGSVVRASSGRVVVRLGDGYKLSLRPTLIRGAGGGGLQAGSAVRVTESFGRHRQVTIEVIAGSPAGGGSRGGGGSHGGGSHGGGAHKGAQQLQSTGTVVQIDPSSFVVQPKQGSPVTFQITPDQLYQLSMSLCNVVTVDYSTTSTSVNANSVNFANNDDSSGQCNDPGPPNFSGNDDVVGPITELTLGGVTISTPNGPMTFQATIDLTNSYVVGDTVDVTYSPMNGALVASDVEYDDHDAIGPVTAVSAGSLTLINSSTGQSQTFTDDPSNGTFDGISVGEQVDVAWYMSNGHVCVDSVTPM